LPSLRPIGRGGRLPPPEPQGPRRARLARRPHVGLAVRRRVQPLKPKAETSRFAHEYLDHLQVERGLSPRTIEAYGHDLARLLSFAERRRTTLERLDQTALASFVQSLRGQGLTPRSVARVVHGVRGFYRFLVREGRLPR